MLISNGFENLVVYFKWGFCIFIRVVVKCEVGYIEWLKIFVYLDILVFVILSDFL